MKILLINPMSSRKPPIKGRNAHFPVGLGYIAASLKEIGLSVDILDNETECLNKYELEDYIRHSAHDMYGITGMSGQYNYIKGLSRIIKKSKDKPVILGGPLATYSWSVVLKNTDVDVCVMGEGEETAADLSKNIDNLESVTGIAYKDGAAMKTTPPRVFKRSRDEYSFPAYELFNMEPYFKKQQVQYEGWGARYLNKETYGTRSIGITTGIGCPYRCRFCSRSVIKPRLRSIDNLIAEIKYCKAKYHVDGVRFLDDLLIIDEKRTRELCEKIRPLNVIWSGQARTNTLDGNTAGLLKGSGCVGIGLGYESGSNTLLKAMNKGTTVDNHIRATRAARDNGLAIRVQIMYGFPGEGKDTVKETIDFFKKIEIPPRRFNVFTPLPGSDVYDECLKKRVIPDEDAYLTRLSTMEAGFGSRRPLVNLTKMSDREFVTLLNYAEKTMIRNYKRIFRKNNPRWLAMVCSNLASRFFGKLKKIYKLGAWKKKIEDFKRESMARHIEKARLEDLYFNLAEK